MCKNKTILKKKKLLKDYQVMKIIILIALAILSNIGIQIIGDKHDIFLRIFRCNMIPIFVQIKVWSLGLNDLALGIWSAQIGVSLIIFTLLSLIGNNMNERILGIRVGSWLLKYNLYFLNLWECIVLIGLLNIVSIVALLLQFNLAVIINFIFIGTLILFTCYLITLIFYKKSRMYYRIASKINSTCKLYECGFGEKDIIKKIKGKKTEYDKSYYREEVIVLAEIYLNLPFIGCSNQEKEILINGISSRIDLNKSDFNEIIEKNCDLEGITQIHRKNIEELKKYVNK